MKRGRTVAALAGLLAWPSVADGDPSPEQRTVAEALFAEGRRLMREGRLAEACPLLAESQRLDPGGGTLLNLATCRKLEGRTATAHSLFREALATARRDGRRDRIDIAQREIEELEPVLARVVIVVPAAVRVRGLSLSINGAPVPEAAWGTPFAVDPGTVRLTAAAPGFHAAATDLKVVASATTAFEVRDLARSTTEPGRPLPPVPAERPLGSIAWRPGFVARLDIDGELRGATFYGGGSVGVTEHLELGAGALLGGSFGFELGLKALPFEGPLRPSLFAGSPTFFDDSTPYPGLRLALGVEWFFWNHLSAEVSSGLAHFPSAPAAFDATVFVPTVALTGRL